MPSGVYKRKPITAERKKELYSDEWKRKQSESHRGMKPWNTGKKRPPFSKEWVDKISKNLQPYYWKGKKQSPEHIEKVRIKNTGKKRTDEQKRRFSLARTGLKMPKGSLVKIGEKNPSWKGGVTPINTKIRMSAEYKLWRMAVFQRDRFTCIWCGQKGNIQADHIKRFSDYPELRFAIDNGRTLCIPCHKTTETYGNKKKS